MIDQKEALETLKKQQKELHSQISQGNSTLNEMNARYLKICGAVEVLSQLLGEEETMDRVVENPINEDLTEK